MYETLSHTLTLTRRHQHLHTDRNAIAKHGRRKAAHFDDNTRYVVSCVCVRDNNYISFEQKMNRQRTGSTLNLIIFLFVFFWLCSVRFAFCCRFSRIILCASFATTLNRIGIGQLLGVMVSSSTFVAGKQITGRKIDSNSNSHERHTVAWSVFRKHQWWKWQPRKTYQIQTSCIVGQTKSKFWESHRKENSQSLGLMLKQ